MVVVPKFLPFLITSPKLYNVSKIRNQLKKLSWPMLNYEEMGTGSRLRPFVRKFWIIDNSRSASPTAKRYALPNTCFTLALVSGNGVMMDFSGASCLINAGNYLVGELTTKAAITVLPYTKAFMVQLNPWAATLLSKCSFAELTNQVAALSDLNKELAQSLRHIDIYGNQCARQQLEKMLESYLYPTAASAFIASCFQLFTAHPIARPFWIAGLADHTGYSPRGIEKKFKQHIGLTPKQAYTILKVRSVVNELISPAHDLSLTALAYKYGYTDQSHFIKTYQPIMKSLPSKFDQREYIFPLER